MQEQDLGMFEQSKGTNEFYCTSESNKNMKDSKNNPVFINSLEKQLAENINEFNHITSQRNYEREEDLRNMTSEKKTKFVHYEDPIEHRCNTVEVDNSENISKCWNFIFI